MNNKGMTLVEVVMAVFLLGIIAVVFFPSTWSSFDMMKKAKEITADTFLAQQSIEIEMERVRDKDLTSPTQNFSSVFGKTVTGVAVTQQILDKDGNSRGELNVFIGDKPDIDENLPVADNVKIVDNTAKKNDKIIYWGQNNTSYSLKGSFTIPDTTNYFMSLFRWYSSRDGFDGYFPDAVTDESYWGVRYPTPVNDYELLTGKDTEQLTDLKAYIGKYVVFSVIPVAKTGRYGVEERSNRIYIMGPPVLNDLRFHFDPYTLRYDINSSNKDVFYEDNESITKWNDYSSGSSVPYALTYPNKTTYPDTDEIVLKWNNDDGKAAILSNSEAIMTCNPTNNNSFTILMVYKNTNDTLRDQNILKRLTVCTSPNAYTKNANNNNGWELNLIDNKIEFKLSQNDLDANKGIVQSTDFAANKKCIITARYEESTTEPDMILTINKEGTQETFTGDYSYTAINGPWNSTTVYSTLGGIISQENVYEIIIYNKALDDSQIDEIKNYLAKKHRI